MRLYGLIGKSLAHSFSERFFSNKFASEGIHARYQNFELNSISELKPLIEKETSLYGLNVTIPYKESVLQYADETDAVVASVGAANCLAIDRYSEKFFIKAFNTDAPAFEETFLPLLKPHHRNALILGTGGASKAVRYALKQIPQIENIAFVSRNPSGKILSYHDLKDEKLFSDFQIIINTTPAGLFPAVHSCPDLPYHRLQPDMLVYDLIYNPDETALIQKAKEAGCTVKNGMEMLIRQTELSWAIWNR
jgi:shikimate dehydrogenase